ncbi:MAG: MogA/MoaB family molybdenum cofactor biosynthesis protein [Phycisphaerales bacterium]|nr:MogA/MoaB family molybdenum cofactor biosynthesis protein [Phycisphaerales bacterium]
MPNRAVVITVSDRCAAGAQRDESGPAIIDALPALESQLVHREIVADDVDAIRDRVTAWLGRAELILLTGGTGVAERDVTPDAIEPLLERRLPGFGEVMRLEAFKRTPLSIVSRSGGGIARKTLIVWLPGSPRGARECVQWLAPAIRHVCGFLRGETPH